MIKAASFLVTILAVGACTTGGLDDPQGTASVFHIDRADRATDGVPYFVHGTLGVVGQIHGLDDVDAAMSGALPEIGRAISVPADQLVVKRVDHDSLGMTHVVYAQRANGLAVVSGDVIVHIAAGGTVSSVTNGARDASAMPTVPQISPSYAADLARAKTPTAVDVTAPDLVYVIANGNGDIYLAWRTDVTGPMLHDTVFVDAMTGQVVARHPHIQPAKNRTIFSNADDSNLGTATQVATEGTEPTDEVAKFAYDNTGTTYDCYTEMFQRDSYDDAGAGLISYVHITEGGQPLDNAFWDGMEMVYGDGDGTEFTELARALDVTAHELTHAVTENTAGLVYADESGALNEASSDILGASCEAHRDGMVSDNTWLIGEEIFTPGTPGDALRYMSNPTMDASLYPPGIMSSDYYPERLMTGQDNGGVHFNSGIANLFYYLLTEGGPHPRAKTPYTVIGIGIDKAEQIWYRSLTHYFTANTTFAQARTATEQAAMELFPGVTKTAVSMAWATVGVGAAPVDSSPPTVKITAPTADANAMPADVAQVKAGFVITADAMDDQGILRVDFAIDGTVIGSSTTAPYMFTSPTALAFGPHTIEATAFDAVNHTSDSVMVNLIDPTCGNTCTSDQTCDMDTGLCVDNAGCCAIGGGGAGGAFVLFAGVALVLGRRRRR
jgi:Zn-dependent metalloprotease